MKKLLIIAALASFFNSGWAENIIVTCPDPKTLAGTEYDVYKDYILIEVRISRRKGSYASCYYLSPHGATKSLVASVGRDDIEPAAGNWRGNRETQRSRAGFRPHGLPLDEYSIDIRDIYLKGTHWPGSHIFHIIADKVT